MELSGIIIVGFYSQILVEKSVYIEKEHLLFVDVKKTYDSVRREGLFTTL
jgi:hypothetical protein